MTTPKIISVDITYLVDEALLMQEKAERHDTSVNPHREGRTEDVPVDDGSPE